MTKTQKRRTAAVIRYTILTIWGVMVFFPLYCFVATSLKPQDQWFSWPPGYFPSPPTLENYRDVWIGATSFEAGGQMALSLQTPFVALRNSLILAFGATLAAVLYGSIIAYGVSRYRLLCENPLFQLFVFRML